MKQDYAVEFKNVSKIYSLKTKDKSQPSNRRFYALKDLTFGIEKGEVVGILGTNGSGKSTLSVILAGISEVDEGEVIVRGEQAMIAINVGLNLQLTGIQNIEYKGALLGLSKKRIEEIKQGVIEFAEIGDFMYQPVKKYSSGMRSRLGFAINLCLDPDVLIVDEALSVGDKSFAQKCLSKMIELKNHGKTIIFISHALPQIREFCTKALWIEGGFLKEYGEVDVVCDHYAEYIEAYNLKNDAEKVKDRNEKFEKRLIPSKKVGFIQFIKKKGDKNTDEKPIIHSGAVRIKGKDRYLTSLAVADTLKEKLGVNQFESVILVSGHEFADALSGSSFAAKIKAPILMVDNRYESKIKPIKEYIEANMKKNGKVYVLGGEVAVPKHVETILEYEGINVTRLKGKDRYGTNLAILKESEIKQEEILVSNGKNFADSSSGSATGKPLLLVGKSLTKEQKEFLEAHPGCTYTILGGIGAISETIEKQLSSYGSVRRIYGKTRYETSVKIAEEYFDDVNQVILAYARNFPDGLSGGPLAFAMNVPLILVDTDKGNSHIASAIEYVTAKRIRSAYVLGGEILIEDTTVRTILNMDETVEVINKSAVNNK